MRRVVLGHFPIGLPCDVDGIWRPDGLGIEVLPHSAGDPLDGVEGTLAAAGWRDADVYLQWVPEYCPMPFDAWQRVTHVTAVWGDWNVAGRMLRLMRPTLGAVLSDHPGVAQLRRLGYERAAPMLPWGWDAAAHPLHPVDAPRDIDVLFIGSRNPAIHTSRERWLARLGRLGERLDVRIVSDVHGAGYRDLLRRARLVFNRSVRGEANMRAFEAAAAGACVLNERDNPTLPLIAVPDAHYASYGADDLESVIERLLADDAHRLELAAAGQAWIRDHTYEAHLAQALATLGGLLQGAKSNAPAPGLLAEQWRLATDPCGWEAVPELLRRHGLHAGASDAAVQLAFAEAACAEGHPLGPAIAAGIAGAPACDDLIGIPSVDFGDWRMALETDVLEADDDTAAAAAATSWIRLRAGYLTGVPDEAADGPMPLVFLRGSQRAAAGELDGALADFALSARERPFEEAARRAHALALALARRRDEAAAELRDFAASLSAVAGREALQATVQDEADELEREPDTGWAWLGADDAPLAADLLRARAAGAIDVPKLRVALPDEASLAAAAGAGLSALAQAGVDPDHLPETDLVVEPHPPLHRWQRLAHAALVIAAADADEYRLAQRLGVPVVDLESLRLPAAA